MSHVFSRASRQTWHWVSLTALVPGRLVYQEATLCTPVLNFCGYRKGRGLSLAADAPCPLHSARPKLAVHCKDSLNAFAERNVFSTSERPHHVPYIDIFVSFFSSPTTTASPTTDAGQNVNVNAHQSSPFLLLLLLFHTSFFPLPDSISQHSRRHTAVVRLLF